MTFNELVRESVRQWPLVVRSLGRSYAQSTSTAEREDAASEALRRFYQCMVAAKFRNDGSVFGWMRTTAGRILNRQITLSARTVHLDDLPNEPQAEDVAKAFETHATLSVILAALRASDREIITMKNILFFSFDKIGLIRGKSYSTVQRQYERAMERTRVIAGVKKPGGGF